MKISVICVGKIKEKYWIDAISEYSKRLSRYCRLNIIEVPDEKTPDGASVSECDAIKKKEAEKILKKIDDNGLVCTLEIEGKRFNSEEFASFIDTSANKTSHIQFVIGGSLGLHSSVLSRSDMAISFSDMTFPHQMMRVILLEQIYRGFRITNGEPYHK
ncbi:MAG: 23S rRNA (pseudouridine(1915)-N(3))-methyltransferase RlmH [Butyrivibrio sp.]|nr:23S rRNA (pseudouridine(1915)-N(3))-methyltransferase RlmH [Butyrivibrio sp.]